MKMLEAATLSKHDAKIEAMKITAGVLLLFATSQLSIPLQPVPITMQTAGVMLIGLLYSRRAAVLTVMAYITLGVIGLPMFQNFASGIVHLHGPTAGYLLGFIPSVFVMSTLREKFGLRSFWGTLLNCIIGTMVVFTLGLSWLSTLVGVKSALTLGLLPFIIPGACKAILLSGALRVIRGGLRASK